MFFPYHHSIRKPIHGMYNLRDLGGLPGQDGKTTRFGIFLRGDVPQNLSGNGLDYLKDLPLRLSIDLRSPGERRKVPSALAQSPDIAEAHIPIINDEQLRSYFHSMDYSSHSILGEFYIYLSNNHAQEFAAAIQKIAAQKEGAVLFHCQQGKDRTGILAALILMLAGVRDDDIIANYQVSYSYLKPSLEAALEKYPENRKQILRSDYWNMELFLDHFYKVHHSAKAYLLNAGCSREDLNEIVKRLL